MRFSKIILPALAAFSFVSVGCSSKQSSFSILAASEKFSQNYQDNRVDVLWVIDNSGSMLPSQQNLADNFPSFISDFQNSDFDFKMAVTTSDAYRASTDFSYDPSNPYWEGLPQEYKARFRDGLGSDHSGVYVINPLTANLHDVFITNIMQGTGGSGDERSLQSIKAALDSPLNAGFVRPGAFLAVIVVTDEEDFSHPGTASTEDYNFPGLYTPQSYVDYLDAITFGTKRFTLNSVTIQDKSDPQCAGKLHAVSKVPHRIHEAVDLTGGKRANLCGNFATELQNLAGNIIQLASQFSLGQADPIPETLRVYINGQELPSTGWNYIEASNSIQFQIGSVPPSGAEINVTFDPKEVTF